MGAKPEKPIPDFLDVLNDQIRIMLIGLTGSGKTTQIGRLAKHLATRKLKTRLYSSDKGGVRTIKPLLNLGFIELVLLKDHDPFVFAEKAAKGMIYDEKAKQWVDGIRPDIGMYAYDSAASIAEEMQKNIRDSQATESPIGPKAYSFTVGEGEDRLTVGTTDKSHVGIVQGRVTDMMWETQKLPGRILLWTSAIQRSQDDETKSSALGVEVIGKALGMTVPRWFDYTWCMAAAARSNGPADHVLYLGAHIDQAMGMSFVVGNDRVPLEGADGAPVPYKIAPADIVHALNLLGRREKSAEDEIRAMLGL